MQNKLPLLQLDFKKYGFDQIPDPQPCSKYRIVEHQTSDGFSCLGNQYIRCIPMPNLIE